MQAVDTNILLRLLVRDDPRQADLAEEFVASGAWVSHLVLAEASWVLATVYRRKPAEIAAAYEMLLDHETLVVQDAEILTDALTLFRQRPSVGFSDCLILELARKAGHLPLGTFDRNLGKLSGTHKLSDKS